MKCNNCGSENVDYARFCVYCGSAIVSEPQYHTYNGYTQNNIKSNYGGSEHHSDYDTARKKGKAGKIIAAVVVAVLLVVIVVGGYFLIRSGMVEIKFNPSNNVQAPVESAKQVFGLNTPIHTAGPVEISLYDKSIQESVLPLNAQKDYVTPLPDVKGSKYIVVTVMVKNISDKNIDFGNIFKECFIKADKQYNLANRLSVYYEANDSTELSNSSTIKPDESKKVYFACLVPYNYAETFESFDLVFGFDSKLSAKTLTKGKEACDYLFSFNACK